MEIKVTSGEWMYLTSTTVLLVEIISIAQSMRKKIDESLTSSEASVQEIKEMHEKLKNLTEQSFLLISEYKI